MLPRTLAKNLCPPLLWTALSSARRRLAKANPASDASRQDLSVYWDPEMARMLETWGEGTTWDEIQLLMAARQGSVLDVACGTGKTMSLISDLPGIEVHGCDISDMLIGKAIERGIAADRLQTCDATATPYPDQRFDYAYTIGSLEHFTEEGVGRLLRECRRITRIATFHNIPVARSGRDEGWIKTFQSYHNNSVPWWLERFSAVYQDVRVLDSSWQDRISVGKWFICSR